MNQLTKKQQQAEQYRKPIRILSLISLICAIFSCIPYFRFDGVYLLILLLTFAPCVLLVLYIFKFYSKFPPISIIQIIFGIVSLHYLIESGIFSKFMFLLFAIATIIALIGFPQKVVLIIPIVASMAYEWVVYFAYLARWRFDLLYILDVSINIIGVLTFFIALLFFILTSNIPSRLPYHTKKFAKDLSPEQALKQLQYKLDYGLITEEEYQNNRAEIISKI